MNTQMQALGLLPKLSEQQLLQLLQSQSTEVPSYAVMAELQSRKKRAADLSGASKPPTSTVMQDMVTQAVQPQMGQAQQQAPMGPPMGAQAPGMAAGGMPGDAGFEQDDGTYTDDQTPWQKLRARNQALYDAGSRGFWRAMQPGRYEAPAGIGAASSAPPADRDRLRQMEDANSGAVDTPRVGTEQGRASNPSTATLAPGLGGGIRASAKISRPGGQYTATPKSPAFDVKPIVPPSIQEMLAQIPQDSSITDQMARFQEQSTGFDQRRNSAKGEALMRAGLAMAGTPGGFMRSIAAGGLQGMNSYDQNMAGIQGDERERMKEMAGLSQAAAAQNLKRYGIANALRFGEAGIADKNQDNRFNLYKANQDAATQRYVADKAYDARMYGYDTRGGAQLDPTKAAKLMLDAKTRALSSPDMKAMATMAGLSPQRRAEFDRRAEAATHANIVAMDAAYPGLLAHYEAAQERSGAVPGGIQVVNGPTGGAVVRPR